MRAHSKRSYFSYLESAFDAGYFSRHCASDRSSRCLLTEHIGDGFDPVASRHRHIVTGDACSGLRTFASLLYSNRFADDDLAEYDIAILEGVV